MCWEGEGLIPQVKETEVLHLGPFQNLPMYLFTWLLLICILYLFIYLFIFRATPAYTDFPRLGVESELQLLQPHQIQATSANYTAACGNTRSLTH